MTTTNVRGFLGLTRYITTFLPALAEHMSVLTLLTTKEYDWESPPWTAEHQAAFEHIKDLVLSADCLTIVNYKDKASNIYVTTDASNCHTSTLSCFQHHHPACEQGEYGSHTNPDNDDNMALPQHRQPLPTRMMTWHSCHVTNHCQPQ
jgi:hypothetical protein